MVTEATATGERLELRARRLRAYGGARMDGDGCKIIVKFGGERRFGGVYRASNNGRNDKQRFLRLV